MRVWVSKHVSHTSHCFVSIFISSLAGAATILVSNPMEVLRIRSSLEKDASFVENVKALGLRGLFSGWQAGAYSIYSRCQSGRTKVLISIHKRGQHQDYSCCVSVCATNTQQTDTSTRSRECGSSYAC